MLSYLACCVVVCTGRAGVQKLGPRGRHEGNNTTGEASQVMHTQQQEAHCVLLERASGCSFFLLLLKLLYSDSCIAKRNGATMRRCHEGQGREWRHKEVNQTAAAIRNIDGPGRLRVRKHCDISQTDNQNMTTRTEGLDITRYQNTVQMRQYSTV